MRCGKRKKTNLKLGAQRHDAHLVRADYRLARLLNALVLPQLGHAVGKQQEDKAAVQQVDAEQVGHEGQLRVQAQDVGDGLGGLDGVGGALCEARRGDPVVLVVEHADGVPLAVEEHVQHVQDEGAVGDDEAHVEVAAAAAGLGGRRWGWGWGWNWYGAWGVGEAVASAGEDVADAHGRLGGGGGGSVDVVSASEVVEAGLAACDELGDDALSVLLVQAAEAWVELAVMDLDDVP